MPWKIIGVLNSNYDLAIIKGMQCLIVTFHFWKYVLQLNYLAKKSAKNWQHYCRLEWSILCQVHKIYVKLLLDFFTEYILPLYIHVLSGAKDIGLLFY